MFPHAYKTAVTLPPLLWVTVFLLLPYALMFAYSFWSVSSSQQIVHSWELSNYAHLLSHEVYRQTLLRSAWIAARVMRLSLRLPYPVPYLLTFPSLLHKYLL